MRIPTITGTIERRMLINYTVDAGVMENYLPAPFRPKLVKGKAIVGICLIRLKHIRPKGMPKFVGIASENAAHRIAVEWREHNVWQQGVYIPRRDTSSRMNAIAGGRVFPGVHHFATFKVEEHACTYELSFCAEDGTSLAIQAQETQDWNSESVFDSLQSASDFFEQGAIGYSPDGKCQSCDGLLLETHTWKVTPLQVSKVASSFFENEKIFPKGSVAFDNALLMKDIKHDWKSLKSIALVK